MRRTCNTYENDEYKFIDFSDILKNIRDSYLEELDVFDQAHDVKLRSRFHSQYLKYSTLTEVLMSATLMSETKSNAILIERGCEVETGGLFDPTLFSAESIRTIDKSKRYIPILIKRIEGPFGELESFLQTGEGEDLLSTIDADRDRLKRSACTFRAFKQFTKKHGLTYINENLVNKMEFKKLFFS